MVRMVRNGSNGSVPRRSNLSTQVGPAASSPRTPGTLDLRELRAAADSARECADNGDYHAAVEMQVEVAESGRRPSAAAS